MRRSDNYLLRPLLPRTVLDSHRWSAIPDIFDRLIVAEAIELEMSLLSCDPVIRDSGIVGVVWD
jgi:PIN domain nuclease of toxin-antitoxin system